jgi:hypothetical protein
MLNAKNLGLAAGTLWGISMFVLTIVAILTGYGVTWLELMASIYPGYTISWIGSIIGLIYGFFDGFVGLYIFGWLYNQFNK